MRWLKRWLGNQGPKANPRGRRVRKLTLEGLEDRCLLSITVPTPGVPGPATITGTNAPDQFVIRLQPGNAANVQLSDNGGTSFTTAALADVTQVSVQGLRGKDTLTLDHANGLVGKAGGLTVAFDGGRGQDQLVMTGNANATVNETYTVGATSDAGTLVSSDGNKSLTVSFTRVSQLTDTTPAASLTVNFNTAANVVEIEKAKPVGGLQLMKIEGVDRQGRDDSLNAVLSDDLADDRVTPTGASFVPIAFANKAAVTVNGLGGDDVFVLDAGRPVTGLTSLTIDGGAGTDRVLNDDSPNGVSVTVANVEQNVADAGDDAFIHELYVSRLKRGASAAEIELWRAVLQGSGRDSVTDGIERSREARTRVVEDWYFNYLGRTPQNGEEQSWVEGFLRGGRDDQLLAGILGSQEFYDRAQALAAGATTDDRFVRALYATLLGRTAGDAEVAGWLNALPQLGRAAEARGFLESREFRERFVGDSYRDLLERDPDAAGLNGWAGSGLDFTGIRRGFLSSLEFFDVERAGAAGFQFDGNGRARLTGTSQSQDDKLFFAFVAPRSGTVGVVVSPVGGRFAALEVENNAGIEIFETEPKDGVNSGSFAVAAGARYVVRLRSPDKSPAGFVVDFTLS